ncbi:MAG TPA: hypothetical protein VE395_03695 [Acidimicrobiales bacterium]|nr:hypothetical protein [Acidimicrobiales bacterium]
MAQAIEAAKDDTAADERPATNPAMAAWITVLVIGGLAAALLLTMAFSAGNTGQSVNGRTATSWSPEPND